jgi:glycosyltransferase involved in cell wall biosynthesis
VTAEIAVVIPSRRGPRLAFALESLADQSLSPERFEVIVVRDPLSAGGEPVPPDSLRLRWLTVDEPCGPTVKRNVGWRAAGAPLVAFTDDECRPARDWLERLVAASDGANRFLQGRTAPDPEEAHLLHGLARSQTIVGPSEWFQCANIAYPRELLERLGGFDEVFTFGSEDTDLGLRALAAGAERVYLDDAVVWHAVIPRTLGAALREAGRWPSQSLVLRRHPGQRRAIYGRYFYKRSHALLLLAAAGGLLARRRPIVGLALALPYLDENLALRQPAPKRLLRRLVALPARVAIDVVETASTARAAASHRVLVL